MDYRNYITVEANKRGGKPCVRGLRITVYEVLEYVNTELFNRVLKDFAEHFKLGKDKRVILPLT